MFLSVASANAATNAPSTGLESGTRHSFGPGLENQNNSMPAGQTIVDAYGKPVIPDMEDTGPRERLRSGAYGGSSSEQQSRPLPDLPETDAGWKFK